ncbi:PP2C family protein-serine/threonine phosphatase [Kitasatospora sp. NBC_01266]|uniref:PP2C family protein-serine/threonine phosphatase n=1 Tax=Kitasatospora sp. NBC_01266 TaxID=2903572 RepID=UPI002E34EA69|nr:PP2C family protein-serine/threonine phosphatase [Kitasatospora sp. NBC_01266]
MPRHVRLALWALIVGGLIWDFQAPTEYWGDPMLAAAAVMAGALLSLRGTVIVGAAIFLGVFALTAHDGSVSNNSGYLELLNTLFAVAVGLWVNQVVARHGRRLRTVRSVARTAQQAVLPVPPPEVGPLAVGTHYSSAQTEALIGGDAYAVQDSPFGVRVMIADVRGKGLQAVRAVSVLLGAFREAAEREPDLCTLADAVEHTLIREVAHGSEELRMEGFITALLGEFDPEHDELRLLDCGHPGPYLLPGGGGLVSRLDARDPGLPLGMGALGGPRPVADSWPFAAGDTLLLVTDGVTEARNSAGEFYDPTPRLATLGWHGSPLELVEAVAEDVAWWTGGPRDDDMALLAVTRRPPGGG